jgi:hypothetical protein
MTVNRTGASSIVDRVDGWGHEDGATGNLRRDGELTAPGDSDWVDATADAPAVLPNDGGGRWDRQLVGRKLGVAETNPDIADRTAGYGGDADPTAGADSGYGNEWETTPVDISGASRDLDVSGSDTKLDHTHSEVRVYNRDPHDGDAAILDDSTAAKIAEAQRKSVIDRTAGWGHEDIVTPKVTEGAGTFNAGTAKFGVASVTNNKKGNRDDS